MKAKYIASVLATSLLGLGLVTGCGSPSGTNDTTNTTTPGATSPSAAPDTAATTTPGAVATPDSGAAGTKATDKMAPDASKSPADATSPAASPSASPASPAPTTTP